MQHRKKRIRLILIILMFLCTLFITGCDIWESIINPTPGPESSPTPSTSLETGRWGESRIGEAVFGP